MLNLEKIILHNFGSYGHAEVDLHNRGFCLVQGKNNYKKDNSLSNGSGKSFIWNAICFAITGETLNGLHTNLKNINVDEDHCYVKLIFSFDGSAYVIERIVAPKSDLKITKDDDDISGKTFRESEKKLGELLPDLTKDFIASTTIIGQGMPNKFSSFSPSGRKELLEKLTKSDFMIEDLKFRIANRLNELSTKLREYEDSLLVNTTNLNSAKSTLERLNAELTGIAKPDDAEIASAAEAVKSLQEKYDAIVSGISAIERDNDAKNAQLIEKTDEKSKLSGEEMTAYANATKDLTQEKARIGGRITSLTYDIKRLKSITDVCPTCGQKLQGVVKPDTSAQEAELAESNRALTEVTNKLNEALSKHNKYTAEISAEFDSVINELRQGMLENRRIINAKRDEANSLNTQISVAKSRYSKLLFDKENVDKRIAGLNASIAVVNETIAKLDNGIRLMIEAKTDALEHIAVVKKMDTLAKRDFRGYLLSNVIAYLDKRAKDYCETVFNNRDLNVYLDGNALDISYCGKMFDNLSGGEKQRVDLILQFAIRDMLITYLGAGSNILVLDEITDFLDKKSCDAIMKLIEKELNTVESVFIVSHHTEELGLPIDSELKIVKNEDGISEIAR